MSFMIDVLSAALILLYVWIVHYKIPRKIKDAGY